MFAQQSCGCPVETSRYPYRCLTHAGERFPFPAPPAQACNPLWYQANCCPFCWRVNPAGLCCDQVETVPGCDLVTCWGQHRMGHYHAKTACRARAADVYLKRIRNEARKRYAHAYWTCLMSGETTEPEDSGLSDTAKRAVRQRLQELVA